MNRCCVVRNLIIYFCIVFVNSAAGVSSWAATPLENVQAGSIVLDAQVQEEISRIVEVLSSRNMPEDDVQKVVQEFKKFKNRTPQELLLQVLAVYGGKDEYRSNPQAEIVKRLLLSNLLQEMEPLDIVTTVAPKYEQASSAKLQKSLRQALDVATFKGGRVDPDLNALSTYIEQNKNQPPQRLVGYMYSQNPQAAVLFMARVYGGKAAEAELADKLKGDQKTVLRSLAERPEWWARLYVAETMKKTVQLRDTTILKKLEADDNQLIREKVADIAAGK